ncbi:MAG: GNAT family N-acetyltransferase [Tissierellia bacterium]|nr:GNAT family N-acetyltransferase [Tissierellia bacterium]
MDNQETKGKHNSPDIGVEWSIVYREFHELTKLELYDWLRLRMEVFMIEQNSLYLDLDGIDLDSKHLLAIEGGRVVGGIRCIRSHLDQGIGSLGRLCVTKGRRGQGIGEVLLQKGIQQLIDEGMPKIHIEAQVYLVDWYRGFGFVTEKDPFDLDGVLHIQMVRG